MSARRQARAQRSAVPARIVDGVPACLMIRACIEVWAERGLPAPHFSARRRYALVRRWWLEANDVTDTRRQCELIPPTGAPWSVDYLTGRGEVQRVREYLAVADCTLADLPALAQDAERLHALAYRADVTTANRRKTS